MAMNQDEAAEAVFEQVFDRTAAERECEINRRCGGDEKLRRAVLRLLALHDSAQADEFLNEPLIRLDIHESEEADGTAVTCPPVVGRYRIIGCLGIGGSGIVYRADAPRPIERQVAVKVLRFGAPHSALQRFRVEQNALSALNHPGIAHIHDCGFTDAGELFAVFELVEGPTITDFAIQCRLDWRERLSLMVQVCAAVLHAHQCGVIHRDLKPGHLLVSTTAGAPVVKIIDFGVAKTLNGRTVTAQTEHGRLVGTFAYMSPELLAGQRTVDTRVDVYALGVILYELLQGRHPHHEHLRSLPDLVRAAGEGRIPALRGTRLSCRRDLEIIIRKAMHPDIEKRYGTAGHLADDLRRVLEGRPIEARSPSILYHATKFIGRQPRVVAFGIAGVVIIIALLGLTFAAGRRAAAQRQALQDTVTYLSDDVLKELREMSGTSESRQRIASLLAQRLDELQREGAAPFDMRFRHAMVLDALGDSLIEQGNYQEAEQVRRRALTRFESLLPERPNDCTLRRLYATANVKLGDAIQSSGNSTEGSKWYDRAHSILVMLSQEYPNHRGVQDDLCWSLERRAAVLMSQGRVSDALELMKERLALAEKLLVAQPEDAVAMHNVAAAHCRLFDVYRFALGRHDLALRHAEQAVPLAEKLVGVEPSRLAYQMLAISAQRCLVRALLQDGQIERAEQLFEPLQARAKRIARANPLNPEAARLVDAIRRETRSLAD